MILIPVRNRLLAKLCLFTDIKPLARPRKTKTHVYQPKENQKALYAELENYDYSFDEPVIIDSYIQFEAPKRLERGKLHHPTKTSLGDEDNLRKAINDALQHAGIISDDSLVLGGKNFKAYNDESFAYIEIYSVHNFVTQYDPIGVS